MASRAIGHAGGTAPDGRGWGRVVQRSSLRKVLRGCRLTRDDLEDILAICLSDAGERPYVSLKVERGISSTQAETLDALLDELRDPATLENLDIWVSSRESDQQTAVYIKPESVTLTVKGPSETWARGRFEELRHRLVAVQKRPAWSTETLAVIGYSIVMAMLLVTGFSLESRPARFGSLTVTLALLLPSGAFLWRRARTHVVLRAPDRHPGPGAFNIVVAVVTIALAVAGLWISWQAWKHPVG